MIVIYKIRLIDKIYEKNVRYDIIGIYFLLTIKKGWFRNECN